MNRTICTFFMSSFNKYLSRCKWRQPFIGYELWQDMCGCDYDYDYDTRLHKEVCKNKKHIHLNLRLDLWNSSALRVAFLLAQINRTNFNDLSFSFPVHPVFRDKDPFQK